MKGDACGTGACAGGAVVCAPDETNLTCTTAGLASTEVCDGLDNDCDGTVDEGDPCDDGLFCTIDVCNGAGGCSYIDRTCADSVDCTVDICDEESDICSSQPDDAFCLPAGQCYYAVCDVQIGCTDILKPRGATCDGMSTEEVCSWSCDGSGTCVEGALADAGEPCVNNGICNGDGRCLYGNGYPCASDGDCQSGNCVDNVCCDTACNGICESCINAAFIGICTYIQEGTDPDNECSGAETCDGAGECAP